jgi:hypothetical protein
MNEYMSESDVPVYGSLSDLVQGRTMSDEPTDQTDTGFDWAVAVDLNTD